MAGADSIRVAVAGAGIGGLTAAIALRRAGFEVVVLERHATFRPTGAGIMLWGETLDALDRLGVGAAVAAEAGVIDRSEFRGPDGSVIEGLWIGSFLDKDPDARPPICIHRAVLHELLLDAAGRDCIRLGAACDAFAVVDGERVRIDVAGGPPVEADVLVGADGIHSAVRGRLFPDDVPRYDGQTIFRGVADPLPGLDGTAIVAIGPDGRFGWEPMGDGTIYWFGGRFQPEGEPDHPSGRKADLLATFGHWAAPVPALIEQSVEAEVLRNDVYVVGPLASWGSGPVTLLGDAAHAVAPHIGQGACLAMEDAAVLAEELASGPTVDGLRRYEARRREAVQPFFERANQLRSGLESGRLVE